MITSNRIFMSVSSKNGYFCQIVLTFECKPGSDLCDWYNMNSFELDQQNLSAAPIWWIQQTVVHFHKKRECRWNINLDLKVDFLSIWHKVLSCKCDLNLHCLWVAINDKHIDPSMNCYREYLDSICSFCSVFGRVGWDPVLLSLFCSESSLTSCRGILEGKEKHR